MSERPRKCVDWECYWGCVDLCESTCYEFDPEMKSGYESCLSDCTVICELKCCENRE